jgi:N-acetylneuraminic acid mutarotase
MAGSDVVSQPGIYGVQGTAAPGNTPGARLGSVAWSDSAGNFWLFGGTAGGNTFEPMNDLWKYSSGQWTWVSGSSMPRQSGMYGTQGTAAAGNVPGARTSAVAWSDASGAIWLFGGDGVDSAGGVDALNDVWKYSSGNWSWVGGSNLVRQPGNYGTMGMTAASNMPGARFGAAGCSDGSGKLWLFGGTGFASANMLGHLNDLWQYQP